MLEVRNCSFVSLNKEISKPQVLTTERKNTVKPGGLHCSLVKNSFYLLTEVDFRISVNIFGVTTIDELSIFFPVLRDSFLSLLKTLHDC